MGRCLQDIIQMTPKCRLKRRQILQQTGKVQEQDQKYKEQKMDDIPVKEDKKN